MSVILSLDEDTSQAQILLGDCYESFALNTIDWDKNDYIRQWIHALQFTLAHRDISGIFKNYEKTSQSGITCLGIYTIIPEEIAYFHQEENKPRHFYITECFKFVTEQIEILTDDHSFELINQCYGHYFPIYYLAINKLSHFYLYLSAQVEGVAHWKVTEDDLKETVDFLTSRLD